jgi:hypothetical protein
MAFLLEVVSLDDQIAAEWHDDLAKEERAAFRQMLEERDWEAYMAQIEEREMFGSADEDEPLPETRILRPWHQNKSFGPWGPKHRKGKRKTLRSHRTGR